jgi:biotin operon repressor
MLEKGFVTLHRKFEKWEWYTETNTKALFLHLLIKANHKETKWRGERVKRGQLLTGRKILSAQLNLSEQNIRTALKNLKNTGEVTIESTSTYSIITLNKYDFYQSNEGDKHKSPTGSQPADNQQLTSVQPTPNQQLTTSNNDNNENNENNKTNGLLSGKPDHETRLTKSLILKSKVENIFECWQQVMNHPKAKLDKKRERFIRDAFGLGYTPEQLCAAITGCSMTPHNMGKNDRGEVYDGLHVIFRDADQIERFMRNNKSPPKPEVKNVHNNLEKSEQVIERQKARREHAAKLEQDGAYDTSYR